MPAPGCRPSPTRTVGLCLPLRPGTRQPSSEGTNEGKGDSPRPPPFISPAVSSALQASPLARPSIRPSARFVLGGDGCLLPACSILPLFLPSPLQPTSCYLKPNKGTGHTGFPTPVSASGGRPHRLVTQEHLPGENETGHGVGSCPWEPQGWSSN